MDRFDDKAREICDEVHVAGPTLAPVYVRLTAAILRAAVEMGKPVQPPAAPVTPAPESTSFVTCECQPSTPDKEPVKP